MARMIPAVVDDATASAAERRIFDLLKHDPATVDWVVLHSLGLVRRGRRPYGEVDFVVLVPRAGVFCLEIKGGRIACRDGCWETTDRNGRTSQLNRSPFLQARDGMFALRDAVLNRAPLGFPAGLVYGYAVVLPDVSFTLQSPEWERWQLIDRDDLVRSISVLIGRLATAQRKLVREPSPNEPAPATIRIVQQLLRPDFEVVVSRAATIEDTEAQLLRLTEDQFDALDVLSDNERCLFEGAAGTGKTMLALEYARRAAGAGRRTLFVCFNRLLGDWLIRQVADRHDQKPTTGSYFRMLREIILRSSIASDFREQEARGAGREFYEVTYATCGKLAIDEVETPYEVLVIDEAQDLLQPGILDVLNSWLVGGLARGSWAMFGDFQRQAIFAGQKGDQLKEVLSAFAPQYAKGRLKFNCRNSRNIGEETALLSGFESPPYRMGQVLGPPVDYHYYRAPEAQALIVADELRLLIQGGVKPEDIVVLSRLRLQHSGLSGLEREGAFHLVDAWDRVVEKSRSKAIRFATIQAFKGMESPVVILCDVDEVSDSEPQALLYVAMSRARSQLIILAHERVRVAVADCIKRKLQAQWKVGQ